MLKGPVPGGGLKVITKDHQDHQTDLLEDVEDMMTLSSSSVTERQRTENPDLPPTCQVTQNNKTPYAHFLILIC